MMTRIVSPTGALILFLLLSALVLSGLTWVTIASLQVESAQQEATQRADRTTHERLALWRMDGLFLPEFGIETNRPFTHYTALHTAFPAVDFDFNTLDIATQSRNSFRLPSPLLSTALPDWMALHFQLDPETGWDSPQVLAVDLANRLITAPNWLTLQNVNPEREALLAELNSRLPKQQVFEQLRAHEQRFADENSLWIPTPLPPEPSQPKSGEGYDLVDENKQAKKTADQFLRELGLAEMVLPVKPTYPQSKEVAGLARQLLPVEPAQASQLRSGPGGFPGSFSESAAVPQSSTQSGADNLLPLGMAGRSTNAASSQFVPSQSPATQANSSYDKREEITKNLNRMMVENLRTGPPVGELGTLVEKAEVLPVPVPPALSPVPADLPPPAAAPRATAAGAIAGGYAQSMPLPTSAPPAGADNSVRAMAASPMSRAKGPIADDTRAKPSPMEKKLSPPAPGEPLARSMDGGDRKEAESRGAEEKKVLAGNKDSSPTEAVPGLAALDRSPSEGAVQPWAYFAAERKGAPSPQPVAVHVGPLRSQWLSTDDGHHFLVLVRAARLEAKTIYQGIVLNWPRVQERLREVVGDLFPQAQFTRLLPTDTPNPERAMTILPVQLDPGQRPELPTAQWTPLRLGLLMAWIAALIALLTVGFGGRALFDLSERRIRFVSAVTHELRTPLTSLRLYLDLLTSGLIENPDKQKEYLTTLADESERLNRLIENVLDFARLEKRSLQAHRQDVPVAELLEQLRQTWQDRCAAEGKELVIISTVPAGQTVRTDLRMATQILGNLIDNSRKYSRDSAEPRIWVWAKPGEKGRIVLEVEDRGPGVTTRERGSIFRPFRRGHEAETIAGGAGLGLALAKQWADLLGGKLTYRVPESGVGACFRLELTDC